LKIEFSQQPGGVYLSYPGKQTHPKGCQERGLNSGEDITQFPNLYHPGSYPAHQLIAGHANGSIQLKVLDHQPPHPISAIHQRPPKATGAGGINEEMSPAGWFHQRGESAQRGNYLFLDLPVEREIWRQDV
jgi:hypothetical protein